MSLLDAQDAVQDRKLACGMSEDVGDGVGWVDENPGMLAGTNIAEDEMRNLGLHYAGWTLELLASGFSILQVADALLREGVLIGIEHAKREKLT